MSKSFNATCVANVVSVDGIAIPNVEIFSEGVGESEGILILDEGRAYYVAKISGDLKTTLEKLSSALEKVVNGLNKCAAAMTLLDTAAFLIGATGAVPSPPIAATDIAGVTTAASQITLLKGQLDTLAGALA